MGREVVASITYFRSICYVTPVGQNLILKQKIPAVDEGYLMMAHIAPGEII